MEFTRRQMFAALGDEGVSKTMVICLRRNNLGTFKMANTTGKNKYTGEPIDIKMSLLHWDVDECIELFEAKKRATTNDPFRVPNPVWIKTWNLAIKRLEIIRNHIQGLNDEKD